MKTSGKKINVLVLSENFFPLSTPSAQRAFAYVKALEQKSYRTVVLTKSPLDSVSEKITVIGLNLRKQIPIFDPVALVLYVGKSIGVVRRNSIDLIISTVPKINNALAGFLLSKIFNIPHIVDVRDYWEGQLLSYPANKLVPKRLTLFLSKIVSIFYRTASSLITVNQTLKGILHRGGVPLSRIHVIPNGIDTSLFEPCEDELCVRKLREKYGLPSSKLIFIYAGSLVPQYRIYAVLEGISLLSEKDKLLFVIVGRPSLLMTKNNVLRTIHKLGLEKYAKVVGPLPLNTIAEYQRCCDVGIIPLEDRDIWKCMTTVKLFAYLASGLPILASGPKGSELERFLSRHKVGVYIGKPTPEGFSEEFRRFLQQRPTIKKIGMMGRKVAETYDRYELAKKIIPIILDLAD